jgi:hypothetical protein
MDYFLGCYEDKYPLRYLVLILQRNLPHPQEIPPKNAAVFSVGSISGIGTGTAGTILYKAPTNDSFTVWWHNPWIGNNQGGANTGLLQPGGAFHQPFDPLHPKHSSIRITSFTGIGNKSKNKHEVFPV